MKKIKLNVDKKAIQDFFLNHLEKLLFAAVMVCFLLFVYGAVGREVFTKLPQDLVTDARDAEKKLESTPPKAPVEDKDYLQEIEDTAGKIEMDFYKHPTLWFPPEFDPPPKRGEPLLFTVRELRGKAGYAAVKTARSRQAVGGEMAEGMEGEAGPLMGPPAMGMGMEGVEGERWIVLTGIVPNVEQIKAYYEAFKHMAGQRAGGMPGVPGNVPGMMEGGPSGTGTGTDMPVWVHFHVQRVEVSGPSDEIDEAAWSAGSIHVLNAKKEARARWGGSMAMGGMGEGGMDGGSGGVHRIYLEQALDFPVPSFADGRAFDESFAHPPQIPLIKPRRGLFGPDGRPILPGQPGAGRPDVDKPEPDKPEPAKPTDKPADAPPDAPPGVPGRGDMPGMVPGAMPGMEGFMDPQMMGMEGMMMELPGGPGGPGGPRMRTVEYKLFRFLDRNAEPGKKYRYRVRLMLANPNYKQNPRYLERIELGKEPYILTEWSDPTDVIDMPRDDRLLVLDVKPSAGHAYETSARVALIKWLNKEGIEASKELDKERRAFRGQVMNLARQKWPEADTKAVKKDEKDKKKTGPGSVPGLGDLEMLMGPMEKKDKRKDKKKDKELDELMGPPMPGQMFGMAEKEPIEVDYATEALVLDLRGGYRIDVNGQGRAPSSDPKQNAPGEMLVLDPDGRLLVRTELDDAKEYEKLQERQHPRHDPMMGPGFMPGMEMEMMMPGYEGPQAKPGAKVPGAKTRPKPGDKNQPKPPPIPRMER